MGTGLNFSYSVGGTEGTSSENLSLSINQTITNGNERNKHSVAQRLVPYVTNSAISKLINLYFDSPMGNTNREGGRKCKNQVKNC